jgi:hypothetical protein
MLPSLPEIDSTLEIVAVSATGALVIAGIIAFIFGTIRALLDGGTTDQPTPAIDLTDRF